MKPHYHQQEMMAAYETKLTFTDATGFTVAPLAEFPKGLSSQQTTRDFLPASLSHHNVVEFYEGPMIRRNPLPDSSLFSASSGFGTLMSDTQFMEARGSGIQGFLEAP